MKIISLAVAALSIASLSFSQGLLQKSDITYLGAFRVPYGDLEAGGSPLAWNPVNGTIFITARDQRVAEVNIPQIVNSSQLSNLHTATFKTGFANITEGKLPLVNPGDVNGIGIGGLLVYGGRLIFTGSTYYDGAGSQVKSHFTSGLNLAATGDVQGPYQVGTVGAGFVAGYMALIPPEWQAALGGPAVTGQCCIPIISRTSSGPALSVFNPDDVAKSGVSIVPASPLVYYNLDHSTLGAYGAPGKNAIFNGATSIGGIVFASGTRSVLFIGKHGIGDFCYGENCNDPADASKGNHAYPYVYQVWAYDVLELAKAKAGTKSPWEVVPYSHWNFTLPFETDDEHQIGGVAYDPVTQRFFVSQMKQDPGPYNYAYAPIIHAFKIGAPTGTPPPIDTTPPPPPVDTTPVPPPIPPSCDTVKIETIRLVHDTVPRIVYDTLPPIILPAPPPDTVETFLNGLDSNRIWTLKMFRSYLKIYQEE